MALGKMSASGLMDLRIVPQATIVNARYYIDNIPETTLLLALKINKRSRPATARNMTTNHSELVFVQDWAPANTVKVT